MSELDEHICGKIRKYMRQLDDDDKIMHALARLDRIDMTVELLTTTNIGKAVNRLRDHDIAGDEAARIVKKWKEVAMREGLAPRAERDDREGKRDSSEEPSPRRSSSSRHYDSGDDSEEEERRRRREERKRKAEREASKDNGQSSSSGGGSSGSKKVKSEMQESNLFAAMLNSGDSVKTKTKKPKPMDWSKNKPEIDLNYRPHALPSLNIMSKAAGSDKKEEPAEFNPAQMFKPRAGGPMRVYAGRRKAVVDTEVPSLYTLCIRMIQNNINAIDDTGDIPFEILRPVLEKCNAQQLMYIESKNPYLSEDSDELWERLCGRHHPTAKTKKNETWKETFGRMDREKEDRLKMLSDKISQSHKNDMASTGRTALISDARAPSYVRKRQMKNGTSHVQRDLPSAIEVTNARRQIFNTGSSSSLASLPAAVRNLSSSLGAKKQPAGGKPQAVQKKGALMLKTMKMCNRKR